MKELQRRQRMRQIMYSWVVILALLALTFFLVKGAWGVMQKERDSASRVRRLEEESARLNSREAELKEEISRLQTEEGVIEEIRDKYSVTQEGEYMAIIVDERVKSTTTEPTKREKIKSWWSKFFNLSKD